MSPNNLREFWLRQSDNQPLTTEQLAEIKRAFGVDGDLRAVARAPGYAVSDGGRVFSGIPCSWRKDCPRELRSVPHQQGYRMGRLHVGKRPTLIGIHVLVAEAFLPPPLPGQDRVRHRDGDPAANHAGNLLWGTAKENAEDMIRHGRSLRGNKNPGAKLNDRRVRIIRELREEGFRDAAIGMLMGVDADTVRRAGSGEQWGHVGEMEGGAA